MDFSSELITIIFAFVRITSFLFFIPFLSGSTIPSIGKITIGLALSFAVVGKMEIELIEINNGFEFIGGIIVQFFIGVTLAKIIEVMISSVQFAGGLMDLDMGFSASSILDPTTQQRTTAFSSLLYFIFVILFIEMGGVHQLILTIIKSFELTATLTYLGEESFLKFMLAIFLYMFDAAMRIALPLMGSMFIINFVMIIMGRTTPQIPILTNSFPIKIAVGLIFLGISMPFIVEAFVGLNEQIFDEYIRAFNYLFTR